MTDPAAPKPPSPSPIVDVLMRGGKYGAVGIFLAALGELAQFVFPEMKNVDHLTHFLSWTGVAVGMLGIGGQVTRGTTMQATGLAEGSIGRAIIATKLAPEHVEVIAKSEDPTVQKEIVRQLENGKKGLLNLKEPA